MKYEEYRRKKWRERIKFDRRNQVDIEEIVREMRQTLATRINPKLSLLRTVPSERTPLPPKNCSRSILQTRLVISETTWKKNDAKKGRLSVFYSAAAFNKSILLVNDFHNVSGLDIQSKTYF